jgi:hypothetical protein
LEITIQDLVDSLLWDSGGEMDGSNKECVAEHTVPIMVRKKRERRKRPSHTVPLEGMPQGPNFLPLGPTSRKFHYLPTVLQTGDQAFNTWALGGHS